MYKTLLCLRYLRTRYIALASVISVMLGVATMIVVNSVMAGFVHETHTRLHGILSDLVVEAHSLDGIENPAVVMEEIRSALGDNLESMTPTVHVPAMLRFKLRDQWIAKQVNLIGIDRTTYAGVSDFSRYLLHPENQSDLNFDLKHGGYDEKLGPSGWDYRRQRTAMARAYERHLEATQPAPVEITENGGGSVDPFAQLAEHDPDQIFDPMNEQHPGIVVGISITSVRQRNAEDEVVDYFLCKPGDDVSITIPTAGTPPKVESGMFTVVDLYESKMSEYDSTFAFVPIKTLQQMRGMIDPQTGIAAISSIQIKLTEGADLTACRDVLRARFPAHVVPYHVQSWRDMQGPLLAAVQMETTILNILLFLIIAVAGFGILATFFMIVVEKTRDIGILRSLGASSRGVMSVFLSYGLMLGIVGAGVGVVMGLMFVANINRIAGWIEVVTGQEVFDPTIYYFQQIPTITNTATVLWIVVGAMLIAVGASVLPSLRAARLHPVEALRYE